MPWKNSEQQREYRNKNKDELNRKRRNYTLLNKDKIKKYRDTHSLKLKRKLFDLLGNKCANPYNQPHPDWCNNWYCLQIDHINNNGFEEINKRFHRNYNAYYRYLIEQIKAGSKDYQLLCANCNWIKRGIEKCQN